MNCLVPIRLRHPTRRRSRVEGTIRGDDERADFGLERVVDDRGLALGRDAIDQALAIAARVDRPILGADRNAEQWECLLSRRSVCLPSRREFPELAGRAGGRVEVPLFVVGQIPDVLHVGVEAGVVTGLAGSVSSTIWPVGPVPTNTRPSGRTSKARAWESLESYARFHPALLLGLHGGRPSLRRRSRRRAFRPISGPGPRRVPLRSSRPG